ncbi:GNAT family N-acetyltransferase [Arcticibacterium luteifluviistationis]|nr:GNAT family N-acetyltransferase [Arcticibacterium luteifluviistationis]
MLKEDWKVVKCIYQEGIDTGIATFQLSAPEWETWDKSHLKVGRLVLLENNTIQGWAALSPTSQREVYKGVCEVSIYIDPQTSGKGFGTLLLQKLIEESEKHGIWTLQSKIFPQNIASLVLHKKSGFREVGTREKIGQRKGIWYDNILLERRSPLF